MKKDENNHIPTFDELVNETELQKKDNQFQVLLNKEPHESWIRVIENTNPPIKYLPIERVEFLLTYIYNRWWVEVLDTKQISNSIQVTIRLFVVNPVTLEVEHQDGIAAEPILGIKPNHKGEYEPLSMLEVKLTAPKAETNAQKDAAEKFGKIFGRDLNRRESLDYSKFINADELKLSEIIKLFEENDFDFDTSQDIQRVIDNKEKDNYDKVLIMLKGVKKEAPKKRNTKSK